MLALPLIVAISRIVGRHHVGMTTGNGLVQRVDTTAEEFVWRYKGTFGGILSLAMHPQAG